MQVFVTDLDKWETLDTHPETVGTGCCGIDWTEDEIEDYNRVSGGTGIEWSADEQRWETDSASLEWWQELAEGRNKAYSVFEDEGECVDDPARNGWYDEFRNWICASSSELSDEKRMFDRIPDWLAEADIPEEDKEQIARQYEDILRKGE